MKAISYAIDYWAWSHALAIKRKARAYNLPTFCMNSTGRCCIFNHAEWPLKMNYNVFILHFTHDACNKHFKRTQMQIQIQMNPKNESENMHAFGLFCFVFTSFIQCSWFRCVSVCCGCCDWPIWLNGRCVRQFAPVKKPMSFMPLKDYRKVKGKTMNFLFRFERNDMCTQRTSPIRWKCVENCIERGMNGQSAFVFAPLQNYLKYILHTHSTVPHNAVCFFIGKWIMRCLKSLTKHLFLLVS